MLHDEGFLWVPGSMECWAMDRHWRDGDRTEAGHLVNLAKYHGDPQALDDLCNAFSSWCLSLRACPQASLRRCEVVVPIPAKPLKTLDIPGALARSAGVALGLPVELDLVRKWKQTPQVKAKPAQERVEILKDVFRTEDRAHGSTVLIVDDLVMTGATISAVAMSLRRAGAAGAVGVAATRAVSGLG
jgi:predicted amidophosphoribosyltransferase